MLRGAGMQCGRLPRISALRAYGLVSPYPIPVSSSMEYFSILVLILPLIRQRA